ncbi:MAG TPA: type VI secretion system tube protein Hcp [Gemmataceae bacterium]|jgi:type VI secretion system secreted protein Hcp
MAVSDYHLEFKGPDVKGESQDDQFKEAVQLHNWSWNAANTATHGYGSGGGHGKVSHGDFQFQKDFDKASAILIDKLNCGDHFKEVILHCRKKTGNDGKALEFLKITMKKCTVTHYSGGGHDSAPTISESWGLGYEEIKFEYTEQKPDGTKGAVVQSAWNLAQNKKAA